MNLRRLPLISLLFATLLMLLACGGGGGSNGPGGGNTIISNAGNITIAGAFPNVQPISVIGFNTPVTSIQVCNTAGANCVTVNNVLVDTGSSGLRVISTAVATVGLTQLTAPTSGRLAECVMFGVSGTGTATFGLVQMGQVKINGETTATHAPGGIPIQVIGDSSNPGNAAFPQVPTASYLGTITDTAITLGGGLAINGILGIGNFIFDCYPSNTGCAGAGNPMYYGCGTAAGAVCTPTGATPVPLASQVPNPVPFFLDNNGTIIQLQFVGAGGADGTTVPGALVFGIGTQLNNGLGNATVLTTDNFGDFTTSFKGQSYPSFTDTGSNGIFFLSQTQTGMPPCNAIIPDPSDFYCPASKTNFSCPGANCATNVGANAGQIQTSFSIENGETLWQTPSNITAFSTLGGPLSGEFDWGLSFFFGRAVYTGIVSEGGITLASPAGVPVGPFIAY